MILTAACTAPAPAPAPPPATESTSTPLYRFDPPVHRNPVTITWDNSSQSFFVDTFNDGTIYRGRLRRPDGPRFLEGSDLLDANSWQRGR